MSSSRPAKSHSRSRRPHMSRRATSQHSVPYLPNGPEELILPGGTVGEEAVDLLHDFVHPGHHHDADATMVDGDEEDELPEDEVDARERAKLLDKPWWKRPSPWWFLILSPLSTIAVGATIAPRVEILTMLACDQLKPEYTAGHGMEDLGIRPWALSGPATSSTSALTTQGQYQHENLVRVQFENTNGTMPQPPPNSKLCKTDPVVQRGVAKLQATMTTTMGILGVLTIGWWGSMSDRYGRTLIVGITILGRIFEDFNFIFVSMFAKRLPGGYWFLLLGPIIEGLMGGIAAASAAIHAYVADCRDPSERSRAFSYLMGAFFIGIALGPTVGGQLVKYSGNILSVYYLAFGVHVLYAVVLWTVLPESRSKVQMATSRRKYNLECAELAAKERSWFTRTATNVTWFARPLAIFIPKRVESATSPGKLGKRDLGLLQVASSQWALTMTLGGIGFKLQYALARFGWTSVEIGYWLTIVGVTRVFHLAVILPLTFRFFKPRAPAIQLPVQDDEPLEGSSSSTAAAPQSSSTGPSKRRHAPHHKANMSFDLGLARISLIFDLVSYVLMALAPTGLLFLGGSVLASLGGGFSPAAQALGLELFARQPGRSAAQAGTLFGAMSVAQALCSQVIGPAVFGSLYSVTVGVLPQSIFLLSAGLVTFSLVMMTVLRLPKDEVDEEAVRMGVEREETVVGVEEDNRNKVVGVAQGE